MHEQLVSNPQRNALLRGSSGRRPRNSPPRNGTAYPFDPVRGYDGTASLLELEGPEWKVKRVNPIPPHLRRKLLIPYLSAFALFELLAILKVFG